MELRDQALRMACGGAAGMVAKTVVAPLERAKLLAQVGASRGLAATLSKVVAAEGLAGLWAGNGANLLRVFPSKGIVFASNDFFRPRLAKWAGRGPGEPVGAGVAFCAGALSGLCASGSTYPLDLVRGRISGQLGSSKYRGVVQVVAVTVREEGLRGLYRGILPTLVGALPYEGCKFGTVGLLEWLSPAPEGTTKREQVLRKVGQGAAGGAVAGLATYPNDTVRRLLQLQGTGSGHAYTGYFDCAAVTYREGGVPRFYRGLATNLVRMVPNTAIQFGTYEFLKQLVLP